MLDWSKDDADILKEQYPEFRLLLNKFITLYHFEIKLQFKYHLKHIQVIYKYCIFNVIYFNMLGEKKTKEYSELISEK